MRIASHRIITFILVVLFIIPINAGMTTNTSDTQGSQTILAQSQTPMIFDAGTVESIRVVEYSSMDAALDAINTGDADIFGHEINRSDYSLLESYPNIKKQWAYDPWFCLLSINCKVYPLNSANLRRAIAYAIDKTEIAEDAMNSTVDEVDFVATLNNDLSIETEEGGLYYNNNVSSAVNRLVAAGMLDVDDDGVVEAPNGSELALSIWYPSDLDGFNETAQIISDNLLASGINNTLVGLPTDEIQTEVANHNTTYHLALYHQELDPFDPSWAATTFHVDKMTEEGENIANIDSSTLNEIADVYVDNIYYNLAGDYVQDALRTVHDLSPVIPLFEYRWLSVYTDENFDGWLDETNGGAFSIWNPVTLSAKSGADNELVVAVLQGYWEDFFTSLNPFTAGHELDYRWAFRTRFNPYLLIYDSAIATAPDGSGVPRHSTSWEILHLGQISGITKDQSLYRFYCDPNAVWSDGEQMDAQDYRFTYDYLKNKSLIPVPDIVHESRAVGDYQSEIEYNNKSMFDYRKLASFPILPRHVWIDKNPVSWEPSVSEVVSSGPYTVSSYSPGSELVLTRNADYYPEVDTEAPSLRSILVLPDNPIPAESVVIRVYVDDRSRIENVTMSYTYQVGTINFTYSMEMTEGAEGYEAIIPARVTADQVDYTITATDNWGNSAVVATGSYSRTTDTATDPFAEILPYVLIGGAILLVVVIGCIVKWRRQ